MGGPAGVYEPALRPVLGHAQRKQLSILHGLPQHEGPAEAGGEGHRRLRHAELRPSYLRGVPADEVVPAADAPDP